MALDIKRFIGRFVGESRERLTELERGIKALEAAPDDAEQIHALFRCAHTIKGSARMLKLAGIGETAHRMEDLLAALRERRLHYRPDIGRLLLHAVDAIGTQIDRAEGCGEDAPPDQALCESLARAAEGHADALAPAPGGPPEAGLPPAPAAAAPNPAQTGTAPGIGPEAGAPAAPGYRTPESVRVGLTQLDRLIRLVGETVAGQVKLRERLREAQALDRAADRAARAPAAGADIAGLAREIHRFALQLRDDVQAQDRLAADLADQALVLRMLPLATIFDPAARMVRELARSLGKEIDLEVGGAEIELDRQIIDGLGEALVHLLRNAVDHGIEDPAVRRAAGKPQIGQIRIAARHAGGSVAIEIADDGRGLDRERILARAIQKGLIDADQALALTDDRVAELIFEPGLSTSGIVTELSGRGVGLDAVKRTIDDLHGALSLQSRPGGGSVFSLKLPLSLALMRVLLLSAGGHCLGLAAQHIVELVRFGPAETIAVAGRPALVLRNEFVPLIGLAELLGLPRAAAPGAAAPGPRRADGARLAVVIGVRQSKLGLTVDRLIDECDMVVKTLPRHMRGCGLVGGIVVGGDNALISVLQAPSLLEAARRARGEGVLRPAPEAGVPAVRAEPWQILVVDDSLNTREIVKEVLDAYGYRVTTAEDGLAGWQKAQGGRFDAVLTDVEMPGLDGFALTARLRASDRYRSTPIIILTSRQKEEDKRRGIEVGADAYIVKGDFDQSSLLDTLRSLLG